MIPLADPTAEYLALKDEIDKALLDTAVSGRYILGPQVEMLEREIAGYTQVAHAVGVASGTDALKLALTACGVNPGDEVVTTPFSFIATADAISGIGAVPVFADIDPATFNLDSALVAPLITDRTRAIVPVHLFGQPADMPAIVALAREHDLAVVEDAAQAIGAKVGENKVGSLGTAGAFSFFPSKNLGCLGDGGMVTTDDPNIAERVRRLRVHGAGAKYLHDELGYNSRLDEIQAAVLRVKLTRLEEWTEIRRELAGLYDELLTGAGAGELTTPHVAPGVRHVYNQYTILSDDRDDLAERLRRRDIASTVYYPRPLHLQKAFRFLGHETGAFPNAEAAAGRVLSLPMYPFLGAEGVREVAGALLP